jgi:hypothetical protein
MFASGVVANRPPRLRLTRRGRVAVLVVLLGINTLCGVLIASASRAAAPEPGPLPVAVVGPHDTLWGIAERTAPDRSPIDVVAEIERLNGLSDSTVHPGDRLLVPR